MILNLRSQSLEESLPEISLINLLSDVCGVLNIVFGEIKMSFLSTAPIHMLLYI
jgi:hypothetical protein